MKNKTNKAKLEIFKVLRKSIEDNYALPANSIKHICLLGYLCMQNSYLR